MEHPEFSETIEKKSDNFARKLDYSMNPRTGTSRRRPNNPNKQEAKIQDAGNSISKPNTTRFLTVEPRKAEREAAERADRRPAKMAEIQAQAAANRREH